jgi:hypothetical protein
MKKIIISIILMLCFGFKANAEMGVNIGITALYGAFDVDGAQEMFKGAHSSSASPGDVTKKASAEGDSAEGEFALASIFIEKTLGDKLAIGIDYVPVSADSDTAENVTNKAGSADAADLMDSAATNTVQVDFEDLTTIYAMINLTDNIYAKAGIMTVDVVTNETLNTGGAYGNTDLDGTMLAIGYAKDLDNGAFVRLEGSFMDFDGASLTNQNDSTKSVKVDGIEGYGAKLSIGKSF